MVVQKPMIVSQAAAEIAHLPDKALWRLIAMMDVNFDIADPMPGHLCKRIEQLGFVLLLWVKEAVTRTTALRIAGCGICDAGPYLAPSRHTAKGDVHRDFLAERLIMIRDRNPQPAGFRPQQQTSCSIAEVPWKPKLCVAGKVHYDSAR